jgi:uncharacterized RDD family membrane protein YckC
MSREAQRSLKTAGLFRRLGAMFYDGLLLIALLAVATATFLLFTGGEAISPATNPALELVYRVVLGAIIIFFFGYAWTRSGQTLGMTTWGLRVERNDGRLLDWRTVLFRLAAAILSLLPAGLGFLWIVFDREGRAWHDRLTGTRVVQLPREHRRRSHRRDR